ncbi:hypothetical protein [Tautonia rosea]|uniref:hypothetical protein n=1 Tax=Tautonia rosea TaxID=2728037 RepID=UPI00147548F3|nr:hypothetical protein [Tautonia rosea]
MDRRRRRFVPGSEGLERRQLLSTVEGLNAAAAPIVSTAEASQGAANRPQGLRARAAAQAMAQEQAMQEAREEVIQMRLQRIERLPAFLQMLDPNRALPTEAVTAIQVQLVGLVGQLSPPAEPIAEGFIDQLRNAIAQSSVNPQTVTSMNFATNRLLASAGASDEAITVITDGLTALAQTASGSNRPVPVMTNDYALVVQTAMGVGRPISRAELLGMQSPLNPVAPQPGAVRPPGPPIGGASGLGPF